MIGARRTHQIRILSLALRILRTQHAGAVAIAEGQRIRALADRVVFAIKGVSMTRRERWRVEDGLHDCRTTQARLLATASHWNTKADVGAWQETKEAGEAHRTGSGEGPNLPCQDFSIPTRNNFTKRPTETLLYIKPYALLGSANLHAPRS